MRRRDEMYARAHGALERTPGAEIVYVEPATMSRLVSEKGLTWELAGGRWRIEPPTSSASRKAGVSPVRKWLVHW